MHRRAMSDPDARGVVPVLEGDDGFVLAESMVILDYLEDIAPVESQTAEQRGRMRLFAALFPGRLSSFPILKADPGSDEEAAAVAKLRADLRLINTFLLQTGPGPFLFGDAFSYAECAAAPFVQRLRVVLPGLRPELDLKVWVREDGLDRLDVWMDAVVTRPSCVNSLPPPQEVVESYGAMVERMKGTKPSP
mmetsp:Transcript_30978/g.51342  ORF Transcript_30978/g.51342 Transcript_30978/m.51342 type:complete len:192 (+) Transcript_30978:198-773(+)